MTKEKQERVRDIFKHYGPVIKTNMLRENKFCSRDIAKLIDDGVIRKIKTGYYTLASPENDMTDLELVSAVIPKGIICLQSAAFYYDLSTQNPTSVSIAIPAKSMPPVLPEHPPVELIMTSDTLFDIGLAEEQTSNLMMRIYNRERTVCDFFRSRKKLGEDLALEVLKNYMGGKRNLQLLMEYAGMFRMKSSIKPYVEALI